MGRAHGSCAGIGRIKGHPVAPAAQVVGQQAACARRKCMPANEQYQVASLTCLFDEPLEHRCVGQVLQPIANILWCKRSRGTPSTR